MSAVRRDRQRLEISREAVELFRTQGVAQTSGEQIAAACGLSARTLWRYFRSKEACVEPVLSLTSAAFVASLRRWPAGVPLEEHIAADPAFPGPGVTRADIDATLAVVHLSRTEPVLRAVWLVVHERAEPVLAAIMAERLGVPADALVVRVRAAAIAAALRITMEMVAGAEAEASLDPRRLLADAIRAATPAAAGRSRAGTPEGVHP